MRAKVVKASTESVLNEKINAVLATVTDRFVDLKLSGSFDGKNETYVAVILYK